MNGMEKINREKLLMLAGQCLLCIIKAIPRLCVPTVHLPCDSPQTVKSKLLFNIIYQPRKCISVGRLLSHICICMVLTRYMDDQEGFNFTIQLWTNIM